MSQAWSHDLPSPPQDQFTFAVGADGSQLSSTWIVRCNLKDLGTHSEPELFIFNLDAGFESLKLSFHCSTRGGQPPRAFARYGGRGGRTETIQEWDWPDTIAGSALCRLACIAIPHSSLSPPQLRSTKLVPTYLVPPGPGREIQIDIFVEPEPFDTHTWPGRQHMGTTCLGQFVYYDENTHEPRLRFILVSHLSEENIQLNALAAHGFDLAPDDEEGLTRIQEMQQPRAVAFKLVDIDGQQLPMLAETPVGRTLLTNEHKAP